MEKLKDLNYWKNNAEEDYITTPISVLRYITELEKEVESKALNLPVVMDWVGVNDELPTQYVNVLVTFKNEGKSSIRTGFWSGNSWIINGDRPLLTEEITFWKQIDSPPCA